MARLGLVTLVFFHLTTGFLTMASVEECGRPLASSRIVGGKDAAEGAWPWQASVQVYKQHVCGGSIITNRWVLSAAHCYYNTGYPKSSYRVCLGMYQLSHPNPNSACLAVKNIIVNSLFAEEGGPGDIMLLELEENMSFSDFILPICLPDSSNYFPSGLDCWVTGWGDIGSKRPLSYPKTLQQVMLPLIDQLTCDDLYHTYSPVSPSIPIILSDMICAGYEKGQKDSCQGDSGGPLVCQSNGSWFQIGIVSWGAGCALPKRPGVYTLVPAYESWIQEHVPGVIFGIAKFSTNGCPTSTSTTPLLLLLLTLVNVL
ncbi:serine protease 33-like [Lissotriton helveticus]